VRAKNEVFAFTMEVITWLSTVEESFGNRMGGKVMAVARGNLKHIRYVKVCLYRTISLTTGLET